MFVQECVEILHSYGGVCGSCMQLCALDTIMGVYVWDMFMAVGTCDMNVCVQWGGGREGMKVVLHLSFYVLSLSSIMLGQLYFMTLYWQFMVFCFFQMLSLCRCCCLSG